MSLDTIKNGLREVFLDYRNYAVAAPSLAIGGTAAGALFYYGQPVWGIVALHSSLYPSVASVPLFAEYREEQARERIGQLQASWRQFFNKQPNLPPLSTEEVEQLPASLDGFINKISSEGVPAMVELGRKAPAFQGFIVDYAVEVGIKPTE